MHKQQEEERERAEKQVQEELEELTRLNNQYNIQVPWKDEVEDVRYLAKDFGNENEEWTVAFDNGFDPLECHNALKDFHGLFDWCEDEYWKERYIARSWNSACYVAETRRGLENLGRDYKLNPKAYKPISDKWKELMPSASPRNCESKRKLEKDDTVDNSAGNISKEATELV